VKYIKIPRLIIPANLDEIVAKQQSRHLNICSECKYVRCSCGGCHSHHCAEVCKYENGEMVEPVFGVNEKVWCAECGGMYLGHSH